MESHLRLRNDGYVVADEYLRHEQGNTGQGSVYRGIVELSVCAGIVVLGFQGEAELAEGLRDSSDNDWCGGVFPIRD